MVTKSQAYPVPVMSRHALKMDLIFKIGPLFMMDPVFEVVLITEKMFLIVPVSQIV